MISVWIENLCFRLFPRSDVPEGGRISGDLALEAAHCLDHASDPDKDAVVTFHLQLERDPAAH